MPIWSGSPGLAASRRPGDDTEVISRIRYHLSPTAIEVKVVLRLVPIACTATTITIDKPPAMMAYSIAVAASSFFRNRNNVIARSSTVSARGTQRRPEGRSAATTSLTVFE